jgi:hypothetical protein
MGVIITVISKGVSAQCKSYQLRDIRKYIDDIHTKVPDNPTAVKGLYKIPTYLCDNAVASDFSQDSLQSIANHINYYLGIVNPVKVIVKREGINEFEKGKYSADNSENVGLYKVFQGTYREIEITRKVRFNIEHIIAILIHESIHNYLDFYKIQIDSVLNVEIATDLSAVYLGFGKFLLLGYKTVDDPTYIGSVYMGSTIHKIGYISESDIKETMNYSAMKRNMIEMGYSLNYYQKLRIIRILKKNRTNANKISKIENNLFKVNMLIKCYSECERIFNRSGIQKYSHEDSENMRLFAQSISTNEILLELNHIRQVIDNKDHDPRRNFDDVEKKISKIEEKISEWYDILKRIELSL